MKRGIRILAQALPFLALARSAPAADVLTVGSVTCPSTAPSCRVPLYLQDSGGSPVGNEQPSARKITQLAVNVFYSDACASIVSPYVDTAGGVLANVALDLESRPGVPGASQAYLATLGIPNGGPLPFRAGIGPPGDRIGDLVFRLTGCPSNVSVAIDAENSAIGSDDNVIETRANGGLTLVDGLITVSQPADGGFHVLAPCRILDTRGPEGPLGGPALAAGATRTFAAAGSCGIPASVSAISANVTVTQTGAGGDLVIHSPDVGLPIASTISFAAGRTRANNAILALSSDTAGRLQVTNRSAGSVHLILDVNGYFQ